MVVLAIGCGASDGASSSAGDAAAFCEQVVALEAASENLEGDSLDDEALASLRSLRDIAPAEVRDAMTVLVELFEQLADVDESDPASAEEAFGLLFDPAVIEAGESIEAFGVSECGLEPQPDIDASGIESGFDDALHNPDSDADAILEMTTFTDTFDEEIRLATRNASDGSVTV